MTIRQMENNSEEAFIYKVQSGDVSASRLLYSRYVRYLSAIVSRYLSNDEDVKDVLQETFLKIFSNIGSFQYKGAGSLYGKAMEGNSVGASLNEAEWKDNPMLGIHFLNRGKEIESHINHRQPIREGISFIYQMNDRIGFESGLTHTLLLSDIKQGSENHYYTGRQSLHYIGIPLHVKYRAFSWKQLDLYTSAGILMENRISGKIEKKYVINNKINETERENIPSKPFQLSANIGVGLHYRLVSIVGIYAEPGLSYYFDDNSDVRTIYKEKPFNFNFNIGLRFTWGEMYRKTVSHSGTHYLIIPQPFT